MRKKHGLTLLELTIGIFLIGGIAVIYLQSMQSSKKKNEFYSEHFMASIMAAKVVEACFQETDLNPYGIEALGLADQAGKPFNFSTLITDGQTVFFKKPLISKDNTPALFDAMKKDFILQIKTDGASSRYFTLDTSFKWKAATGAGIFNYLCRFPNYVMKKEALSTFAFPESELEKKVVERIFEEKNKSLGTIVSSPAAQEVALATGRIYFTSVGMFAAPEFTSAYEKAERIAGESHAPNSAEYKEGTEAFFVVARDLLDVMIYLQPHLETISKDISMIDSLNLRNKSRLELYIFKSTLAMEKMKQLFFVCVNEAASRYKAQLKVSTSLREQRLIVERCFSMHRLIFSTMNFCDGVFPSGNSESIIKKEYYDFLDIIGAYFTDRDNTITRLAAQEKKFTQGNQLTQRYFTCNLVYGLFATISELKTKLPTIDPGTLDPKTEVIGEPMGDGSISGALTWAQDQMEGGTCKGINGNNGQSVANDPTAWNNYCLAFVSTAYGRKIPELREESAFASYTNFNTQGKITRNQKPPAGAIMYTAPTSSNEHGHIFLATGKLSPNGDPIIITSGWNGQNGITEMTLTELCNTLGANYLGWVLPKVQI